MGSLGFLFSFSACVCGSDRRGRAAGLPQADGTPEERGARRAAALPNNPFPSILVFFCLGFGRFGFGISIIEPVHHTSKPYGTVPAISKAQMIEVDRLMTEVYGISLLQMMENAGRGLATLARSLFFKGRCRGRSAVVLAGSGGNGGGALAAARRLHIWGANVRVVLSKPVSELRGAAALQMASLQQMGIVIVDAPPVDSDLLIDGLIGYSLHGAPSGRSAELISWINRQITPVLSLDLPSGLDPDSGLIHQPCVRASATLTLALPKTGLLTDKARPMVGELFLADISVPPSLYRAPKLNLEVGSIFSESDIVKVR